MFLDKMNKNAGEILQKYLEDHGIKPTFVAYKIGMSRANINSRLHERIHFRLKSPSWLLWACV